LRTTSLAKNDEYQFKLLQVIEENLADILETWQIQMIEAKIIVTIDSFSA